MKKKIATLIISTSIILSSTIANAISDIQEFTDYNTWSTHWGLQDIQTLVLKGGIKGIPNDDGTFRFEPNRSITTAELLSIILNTSGNAPTSTNWPMNVMNKAIDIGILPKEWANEDGNNQLSREQMAVILKLSAMNILKEDINHAPYSIDKEKISDLNQADKMCKASIVSAYNLGLIAGTGEGFNPKGETTRAECCAVINRLFNYTSRVDNSALGYEKQPSSSSSNSSSGSQQWHSISIEDLNVPREGDVVNGVTVTRDPETGVLGYGNGQKGGIYLGRAIGNTGKVYTVGTSSPYNLPYYDILAKGSYEQKGDYVYWSDEWLTICGVVQDKLDAEHPDAPKGTCADIYGNILEGVTDYNQKDVFFVIGTFGWEKTQL